MAKIHYGVKPDIFKYATARLDSWVSHLGSLSCWSISQLTQLVTANTPKHAETQSQHVLRWSSRKALLFVTH